MWVSILFLISCVITARFLDKYKMRAASIMYSVLFIVILSVLMIALDVPYVDIALSNLMGSGPYDIVHDIMSEVISMSFYGISIFGALLLTFAAQAAIIVIHATRRVVRCFAKDQSARKFKKNHFKSAHSVRSLYLPKSINLLYCRMLN